MSSSSSFAATPSMAASGRHDRGRMALILGTNGVTICAAKPVVIVTVAELAIESFFPADPETGRLLRDAWPATRAEGAGPAMTR